MRDLRLTAVTWLALLTQTAIAQRNLLPDGAFENGFEPWCCGQEKSAKATGTVEAMSGERTGQAAKIVVTQSERPNHVQVTCSFASSTLVPQQVYRLSFAAKAEPARSFHVCLIGQNRPWGGVGLRKNLSVGTEWQPQEILFRAREPKQETVKLDFFLGAEVGAFWFDDVVLVAVTATARTQVTGPVIETESWQVRFSEKGAVGQVSHKPSQTSLTGGYELPPAYELTVRTGDTTQTIPSTAATSVTSAGDAAKRQFTFVHEDMTVVCTAARNLETGLLEFNLSVDNRGGGAITDVRYPILICPAKLGDRSEDDAVLYPKCDGGLIENPLEAMRTKRALNQTYPGPLSCQLMAYYDPTAGVYLATYDAAGHAKKFNCVMGLDLKLSITHLFPIAPGADVEIAYPTVLGTFTGDWYAAAEIYRRWSSRQAWCAKTLLQRPDTPEWVKRGAMVTCYNPRPNKAGVRRFDPKGLHTFLKAMQDDFGLPTVPNNRGWEQYGEWCGQEYWPPYPSVEGFRQDAEIIQNLGHYGMIMLSGYRWTIDKQLGGDKVHSNQELFDREIVKHVTYEADGETPKTWTSEKPRSWRGLKYARLCPATRFAEDTVVEIAERCVESGYPVIHFDQEVSGSASSSYCGHRNHGHPPGYGPWIHEALARMYQRLRDTCAPLHPDFTLSMEEPNELYIPWLNICQSRPNGLTNEFPLNPPMTRVVPLFSYLYHDYLVGWIAFYPWRSAGRPTYTLANGFCAGMMPGLHRESVNRIKDPEKREQFNTMLRNCSKVYAGSAREYLTFGKMHKPLKLKVPVRQFNMGKRYGITSVPAVSNSVWELPDGRKAVVLVNPEAEVHTIALPGLGKTVSVPPFDMLLVEF